jgi:hypothetical protein
MTLQNSIQNTKLRVNSCIKHLAGIQTVILTNQGVSGVAKLFVNLNDPTVLSLPVMSASVERSFLTFC